jgi:hypothetical protein
MSARCTPRPVAGRAVGVRLGGAGADAAGRAGSGVSGRVVSSGTAIPLPAPDGGVSVWWTA